MLEYISQRIDEQTAKGQGYFRFDQHREFLNWKSPLNQFLDGEEDEKHAKLVHKVLINRLKEAGYKVHARYNYDKDGQWITQITWSGSSFDAESFNAEGEMINADEEKMVTDYVNDNHTQCEYENMKNPEVFVGYDTRKSSPIICNLIISGILELHQDSIIHNLYVVTTPELHYAMYTHSKQKGTYVENLHSIINHIVNPNIICDCANGVGTKILTEIKSKVEGIKLINTDTQNHSLLNEKSGSDYVVNQQCIPCKGEEIKSLYASLDGDADRVVFYYRENKNKFH